MNKHRVPLNKETLSWFKDNLEKGKAPEEFVLVKVPSLHGETASCIIQISAQCGHNVVFLYSPNHYFPYTSIH